jgi:hypothetical protein
MTRIRSVATLLGGLAASLPARASDLHWSGGGACTEKEQLLFQVERALGAPLASVGHLQLQIQVERTTPDAKASLRVRNDVGDAEAKERSLVARDCSALVDTLAVAIALAVEQAGSFEDRGPQGVADAAEAKSNSTSPGPETGARSADAVAPITPSESVGSGPLPRASAELVGDSGSLPAPAFGVALGLELDWPQVQLELLGTLWLQQHPALEPTTPTGAGADLDLATATVRGCTNPLGTSSDPLSAALCLSWEMGRLSGRGTGVTEPRRANALWLAPGLQARLAWQLPGTRLRINAELGAALPLERSEFVLDRLGTVHQPDSLVTRAAVGIDVAFR